MACPPQRGPETPRHKGAGLVPAGASPRRVRVRTQGFTPSSLFQQQRSRPHSVEPKVSSLRQAPGAPALR